MKLEILQVPDCPNVPVLEDRIRQAAAGAPVEIVHRVITDPDQAAAAGMAGSPTLLIDGRDPFATAGQVPSLSCRLYPTADGGLDGAPSVGALCTALGLPAVTESDNVSGSVSCCTPSAEGRMPVEALSSWRAKALPAEPAEKAVHRAILLAFAAQGRPPTADELAAPAAGGGFSVEQVLRGLHDADVIRLDAAGEIASAYPFAATPTRHRARIAGGATVYTMCAIDALGLAAMLDTEVYVDSSDPVTGEPITVAIEPRSARAQPATVVVFVGGRAVRGPSADTCCNYLNFFTNRSGAEAWAAEHPEIGGIVLDLAPAHDLGNQIFANLLPPE
ncbi:organomercurial lyase [Nocardia lijiangensis]|uniref:organomercurial lyase n=1 Tax=Nocardia lijiangensis TaxID=299618 RepID=UPI000831AA1C|nr:organomercurial lyase [Nocardia lijiangensis]